MIIEPGEAHDVVATARHAAHMGLDASQLANYLALPRARSGQPAHAPVPTIDKMSTVTVLSWHSDQLTREEVLELSRIERAFQSVTILSTLRQDLLATPVGLPRVSSSHFCQTLADAITENVGCLMVALEFGLFDFVHVLATSMSSNDHVAVLPVFRSLVLLLQSGALRDEPSEWETTIDSDATVSLDGSSLQRLIDSSNGVIRTKRALLGHLKYYLHYLDAVSPTDGNVLMEVSSLLQTVARYLSDDTETSGVHSLFSASSREPVEMKVEATNSTCPQPEHPVTDCVLCKYNVPGTLGMLLDRVLTHMHLTADNNALHACCLPRRSRPPRLQESHQSEGYTAARLSPTDYATDRR